MSHTTESPASDGGAIQKVQGKRTNSSVYANTAPTYQRKGWSPLPLPRQKKSPPPTGWTGYDAPMASGADVAEWASSGHAGSNIGLRTPQTVLGLDVDAYGDKAGLDTLLGKVDELGPLPPTHISTSRNDGVSGIRFYRVPAGRRWADILGPGVEIIHYGHRYAVAAPSIHPEGRTYRWIGPDGQPCDAPAVDDLPDLPDTWAASLDGGDVADRPGKADVDNDEVRAWLDQLPQGEPCAYLTRLLEAAEADLADPQTRHDKARTQVARIVRGGDQGHTGAATALDTLQSMWLAALKSGSARRPDPGEWSRMVAGAVAMCTKQPTPDADRGCCGGGSDTAWIPDHVPDTLQRKVAKRVKVQLKPGTSTAEIGRAILEGRHVNIGEHVASVSAVRMGAAAGDVEKRPVSTWQPQDLAATVRGLVNGTLSRPTPTLGRLGDDRALFYSGRVNGVAGDSNAGKTWSALQTCAQEVEAGNTAVYIDYEDTREGVVARLLDMGADADAIVRRFVYIGPAETLDVVGRSFVGDLIVTRRPTVVVVDSTGESLSVAGANPNADEEVARWFQTVPTWVARQGPGVIVLDHVTKAGDGGLWPIGSQRKRAAITGAQYMQEAVRPFAKGHPGHAKLICAKDRHGTWAMKQHVADVRVTPGDGTAVSVELVAPEAESRPGDEGWRPTGYMERVSRVLEIAPEPLSGRGINDRVEGKERYVALATDYLVREGYVATSPGPRRSTVHTLLRPYREASDESGGTEADLSASVSDSSASRIGREAGGTELVSPGRHWEALGGTETLEVSRRLCGDCEEPQNAPPHPRCSAPFWHTAVTG